MPMYTYYCESCDRNFSTIAAFKNRKRRRKCSNCGKCGCPHTWDYSKSDDIGIQGIRGGDTPKFYGDISKRKKVEKKWLEDECKHAKGAIKGDSGVSPYSKMDINHEFMVKQGVAKKVSKKEARIRKKNSRKLTQYAAKDISKEGVDRMTGFGADSEAVKKDK